jgi:GNAT superfamily N-acetyltransferase
MASTEHPLGPQHLAGCLELSRAAHWNQNEADWRLMLDIGHGWGITVAGVLAASTLVLPFGSFAWISMVLVLPEHRRKGYATCLLRVAVADLLARGLTPVLDATPAGREVYRQEGFHDTWTFKRFFLTQSLPSRPDRRVRRIVDSDWERILRLDLEAFGAGREKLLRNLHGRCPEAALVCEEGFVLGREGRESRHVGPLVAESKEAAQLLMHAAIAALGAPLYIDLADHAGAPPQGFEFQRPFTRMVYGNARAPGDASRVFLVAGPELG